MKFVNKSVDKLSSSELDVAARVEESPERESPRSSPEEQDSRSGNHSWELGKLAFPELEAQVRTFWQENQVFQRLLAKNKGGTKFRFLDGPITANNLVGVHHAWGRTLKDVYQRYWALRGFEQRFQNGYDCQGLWVEVEVERALGLKTKQDLLNYGLEQFSRQCRQRVEQMAAAAYQVSARLGQLNCMWPEDQSYFTMADGNIEAIWHFLKACHEKNLLYQGTRVMQWCVRCGTSLSEHEMADSYEDRVHTAVFLALPLERDPQERLLVWTTTPWTLLANVALAVHPDLTYALMSDGSLSYWVAATLVERLCPGMECLQTCKGSDLVGLQYRGPFPWFPKQQPVGHQVVSWDEVNAEEGTGVVHIAPGCGVEDYDLGVQEGLPLDLSPLDEFGNVVTGYGEFEGQNVQEVVSHVVSKLEEKGLLFQTEEYEHRYPVCWRCHEDLVFRLVEEWFLDANKVRQQLLEAAEQVNWQPAYLSKRMQDWLENMGDWCISRKRFWGLPLPFYPCPNCSTLTVVGSKEELQALSSSDLSTVPELHKPWVDSVQVSCPACHKPVSRVPEVGDCWLDAGIVPFSTQHYFADRPYWEQWFPVDLVLEMKEQVRLWFYSMLFMSVVLTGQSPYRTVAVHGAMRPLDGGEFHKSGENSLLLADHLEKYGADVLRWVCCRADPTNDMRFDPSSLFASMKPVVTFWHVLKFFVELARLDQVDGLHAPEPFTVLDKWVLSRLAEFTATAQTHYEAVDVRKVCFAYESFVQDLSTWYLRNSRRRFWKTDHDRSRTGAYATLHYVLRTTAQVMAPILPHFMECCHQLLRQFSSQMTDSVHLEAFPQCPARRNVDLEDIMGNVRVLAGLGRNARAKKGLKLRQPLAKAYVLGLDPTSLTKESLEVLANELNVKEVLFVGKDEHPETSLVVVEEQKLTLALDTTITPDLQAEGIARDAVRVVQQLRKELNLALDDQITVSVSATDTDVFRALETHQAYFMKETQALTLAYSCSFAEETAFFSLGPTKLKSQWVVQRTMQGS
ncbi:MAG: isoleucine--tRNA ligase [Candidatus Heimdallarchaeota archaeon]